MLAVRREGSPFARDAREGTLVKAHRCERLVLLGMDARMQNAYEFLGIESNPIPVKAVLAHFGIGHGLRLPLLPLSNEHAGLAVKAATDILAIEQSIRDALAA